MEEGARATLQHILGPGTSLGPIQVLFVGDMPLTPIRKITVCLAGTMLFFFRCISLELLAIDGRSIPKAPPRHDPAAGAFRPRPHSLSTQADDVNKLVVVPGIIISSSRTRPKAVEVTIQCRACNSEKKLAVPSGLSGLSLPRHCDSA